MSDDRKKVLRLFHISPIIDAVTHVENVKHTIHNASRNSRSVTPDTPLGDHTFIIYRDDCSDIRIGHAFPRVSSKILHEDKVNRVRSGPFGLLKGGIWYRTGEEGYGYNSEELLLSFITRHL